MNTVVLKQLGRWILRGVLRRGAEEVIERLDETRYEPQSVDGYSRAKELNTKTRKARKKARKAARKARKLSK